MDNIVLNETVVQKMAYLMNKLSPLANRSMVNLTSEVVFLHYTEDHILADDYLLQVMNSAIIHADMSEYDICIIKQDISKGLPSNGTITVKPLSTTEAIDMKLVTETQLSLIQSGIRLIICAGSLDNRNRVIISFGWEPKRIK